MKPILIDALYINMGGALTVLNRLIDGCVGAGLDFVLLKDNRCPKLRSEGGVKNLIMLPPSLKARHKYYKEHKNDYHSVLCMGNVPPTVKMPCPVHTYFHNLSVLKTPAIYSIRRKFLFSLKRHLIHYLAKYTDTWIVQTKNTKGYVKEYLDNEKKILIYPIYQLPMFDFPIDNHKRDEYVFIGDFTFSKGHDVLLRAWEKLFNMGKPYKLNLTVNRRPATEAFCKKMEAAIKRGVPIINHGVVPFDKVGSIYARCKAVVYPSLIESLGLGIVEGIAAGCDVIVSDLPYAHSICKPSETFNPNDENSIVDAILRYEKGESPNSELTIHDFINELIELLKA